MKNEKYELIEIDEKKLKDLEKKYSSFLAKLLLARGIETEKDAEKFLNISWDNILDPFLFNDMQKAVDRIFEAIDKSEKIVIFSDYDADGIPGAVALHDFFKKIKYTNFENYIPDRNKEGFGLNSKVVEKFKNDGVHLVITIDCGIADIFEAEELKKAGIDLIITDHHKEGDKLPEAVAILDHQVEGEKYPEKVLSGAGVVFKLIQALLIEGKKRKIPNFLIIPEGWEKWLLDMIGTATICDMVPLKGENRILAHYGKLVIGKSQRDGLLAVLNAGGLNSKKISCQDIAFSIGPRINAAGRLEHPDFAFKTFAEKGAAAIAAAQELEKINRRRKSVVSGIMRKVYAKLDKRDLGKVVVIGDRDWPLGVVGLIAGKIADRYKVSAFVWTEFDNKKVKGSVRSNGEISIHSLMEKTKDSFVSFGGHEQAGGFEAELEKIHLLEEKLNENFEKAEKISEAKKKEKIDLKISLDEVSQENMNEMKKLAPFGMENPTPKFFLENLEIFRVKIFGKNEEHLELIFKNSRGQWISAISFFYEDKIEKREFSEGQKISLVMELEENNFLGNTQMRMKILDIF